MSVEHPESRLALPKGLISIMDVTRAKHPTILNKNGTPLLQVHRKRMFRYFTLESLLLLVCLTASLLFLPLVLPPLPPPPFMVLLVPICLLVLLMILAFMPSNIQDVTYTYV
ncbi:ARGOS-like protein [Forsythia ovata]|uniref:ARGOS-like protein n=1 Tax=Forsythia ovata TaxID=205694 RepID=A0ABD1UXS3_9LAMI